MNQPQEKIISVDFENPQPYFDKGNVVIDSGRKSKASYPKSVIKEMVDIIRQNQELVEKTGESR